MTTASATRPQNLHPGAQLGAQPGAQVGAQLPEDPADTMPIEPAQHDVATVLRVMSRHGVNQGAMARDLNINPGHMSRILAGHTGAPLPFAAVQYLWSRTGDQELLTLFSSDSARLLAVAAPIDGAPRTLDHAEAEMIRAVGELLSLQGKSRFAPVALDSVHLREITAADAAIGAIADYQAALTAGRRAHRHAYAATTEDNQPRRTIDRLD